MKCLFVTLTFILFGIQCHAADTLVTKFINSIYTQVVDSSKKTYYLYELGRTARNFTGDTINFSAETLYALGLRDKSIPFNDFRTAIKSDTTTIKWRDYNLKNVKLIDHAHMDCGQFIVSEDVPYNTSDSAIRIMASKCIIAIPVKSGMTRKERKAAEENACKNFKDPNADAMYCYFFSRPVFSKDGNYALMTIDGFHWGEICVFKSIAGKWTKVFTFGNYNT